MNRPAPRRRPQLPTLAELRPAITAWLATSGVAVLDVRVDPDEEPVRPEKLVA